MTEFDQLTSLLQSINWYKLGTLDSSQDDNCISTNDYVTTSYLSDRDGSVSYVPQSTTVIVDLSEFNGAVTVKWYDPTSGNSNTILGSRLANIGRKEFSTPGNNSAGRPD